MIYPSNGVVTQGFSKDHPAVDIAFEGGGAASYGKPIVAPEDGIVTFVGQMGSGVNDAGTVMQIRAGNRTHRLCHLIPNSPTVKVGDTIKMGQQVGKMGYSGYVKPANKDGTHLHWVMEINGVRVDGRKYVTEENNMNDTADNYYVQALAEGGLDRTAAGDTNLLNNVGKPKTKVLDTFRSYPEWKERQRKANDYDADVKAAYEKGKAEGGSGQYEPAAEVNGKVTLWKLKE